MPEITKAGEDFCEFLRDIRHGETADRLTRELRGLVARVRETGRRGSLSLKIDVGLASTGDSITLQIGDTVKVTLPTAAKVETIFYSDNDNLLQRHDPRQPVLKGLRVPTDARASRATTTSKKEGAKA